MIKRNMRWFLVGLVWLTLWVTTAHAQSENENTLTAEDWDHLGRTCPDLYKDECAELVLKYSFFPPLAGTLHTHLWLSRFLSAMEEPVLSENKDPGFEAYRLLTFSDYSGANQIPVVVRVQNEDGAKTLVVKRPDSPYKGSLSWDRTYKLAPQEWDEIVRLVDEADYWHLAMPNLSVGLHGWRCILEGVKDGRYHVVHRWEPSGEDLPFRKACEYLESFAIGTETKP